MPMTIAMLSDFGLADPYVGQIKGVFSDLAPGARIVDLCHDVQPYGISQAAFFLQASWRHFPLNTVFMAVVDPGVGSSRRIVCLTKHRQIFLAPDNGLLGLLLEDHTLDETEGSQHTYDLTPEPLSKNADSQQFSSTFHGRDIFAPLAAQIALGEEPQMLGPEIDPASLVRQPWAAPTLHENELHAHVLHIDRFGNVILNIADSIGPCAECADHRKILEQWAQKGISLDLDHAPPLRFADHYSDLASNEVGLIAGSQGFLELSMNMLSAARTLRLHSADKVVIRKKS